MDGLQITGPATSALTARVAAEQRAAAERSELRSRVSTLIGECDAYLPRRACPACGHRNPATEPRGVAAGITFSTPLLSNTARPSNTAVVPGHPARGAGCAEGSSTPA